MTLTERIHAAAGHACADGIVTEGRMVQPKYEPPQSVVLTDGTEVWLSGDVLHRDDGPAYRDPRGVVQWWSCGRLHRVGGPAIVYPNGSEEWYWEGYLHRVGGPAIKHADGHEEWLHKNTRHRVDGPALTRAEGTKEWWVEGVRQAPPMTMDDLLALLDLPQTGWTE
jgi:hypothetical protein